MSWGLTANYCNFMFVRKITLRTAIFALLLAFGAHGAAAQDSDTEASSSGGVLSPEEMLAEIDRRAGNASGYDALLQDPDPRRSAAAVTLMMESGSEDLMRKAMSFGLASPESSIRSTALTHYLKTLPTLALDFDATAVTDDQLPELDKAVRSWDGSLGHDKKGSFSVALGPWNEDEQCYGRVGGGRGCSARINAQSVSVVVANQWINLNPDAEGNLQGGMSVTNQYSGNSDSYGPLKVTVRLVE